MRTRAYIYELYGHAMSLGAATFVATGDPFGVIAFPFVAWLLVNTTPD